MPEATVLEPSRPAVASAEREFRFTPEDFRAIAAVLREEAGIHLPEGKATLVYARLSRRLRTLRLGSFGAYAALLHGADGAEERRHLVSALTTNVTRFFREPHHFEHLRGSVLPGALEAARRGGRVRLWSAACSSGQEPYSIAALVAELMPDAARFDVKVLATDIDPVVLDAARAGRYMSIEGVPAGLQRWFERDGDGWSASAALRALVTFRQLNLTAPWPVRGPFDAVFCRNVAIYFDAEVQARLWAGFADVVGPGGFLYIGHSERLAGNAVPAFQTVGITAYRRRGAAA